MGNWVEVDQKESIPWFGRPMYLGSFLSFCLSVLFCDCSSSIGSAYAEG